MRKRGTHIHWRIPHRIDAALTTNIADAMEAVRSQHGPAIDAALRDAIAQPSDFSALVRLVAGSCRAKIYANPPSRAPTGGLGGPPRWRVTWLVDDAVATAVDVEVAPRRGVVTLTLRRGDAVIATSHYGPTTSMIGLDSRDSSAILMRNFVATRGEAIVRHLNNLPLPDCAFDDPLDPPQTPRSSGGYRIPPEAEIFADFAIAEAAIRVGRMAPSPPSAAAAEVMVRRRKQPAGPSLPPSAPDDAPSATKMDRQAS